MNKKLNQFEKALDQLPEGTGFDAYSHKTLEDLCWVCLHELDLHAESEYFVPVALRRKYLAFIRKHGFYLTQAVEVFAQGKNVSKSDCEA
jgi:hypothetical protein